MSGQVLASIAAGYASTSTEWSAASLLEMPAKAMVPHWVGNFENSRKAYGALIQKP